ncbi:hypothetical protein PANO111632_05245 [Paracoccus nototheniae]|uniref:DUF4870 family protein n=1 Tax=Paracoccus nototheniae TaxID=2489002 RepID=A0ABW4DVW6_9RHOB|nr:hypothetical protein [Paracoccus nototheniae]
MTPFPDPSRTLTAPDLTPAKIVYGLYALGYLVGLTTLVGVVYAYVSRGKDPVLDSHLQFQIRTFWISLAIALLAFVTIVIGIGFLVWAFLTVWGLIRVISGFLLANDGKPVTGTRYWGIMAY